MEPLPERALPMKSTLLLRLAVATVWFYQGLVVNLLLRDSRHLKMVAATAGSAHAPMLLTLLGVGETLLGLCVLIGLWTRPLAITQMVAVVGLWALAIAHGAIGDPVQTVIAGLPLLACLWMLAANGPGRWSVQP